MRQRILRPMSYGDILDEMFDLYKSNFVLFVGIIALVYIPLNFVSHLVTSAATREMLSNATIVNPGSSPADPGAAFDALGPMWLMLGKLWLLAAISLPFHFMAMGASTWAISKRYLGETVTILSAYKDIRTRLLPLIVTSIPVVIVVYLGLACCCLPGIPLVILAAFVPSVIILENKGYIDAIVRSAELAAKEWSRILVVLILLTVLWVLVIAVVTVPFQVLTSDAKPDALISGPLGIVYSLTQGIAQCVATPIWLITLVLLYYDVRVRREGFDLELLAASINPSNIPIAATGEDTTSQ